MAAVAQLKADPKYSAVHELLHIFSVEKLGEYMAFHKVCACVGVCFLSRQQYYTADQRLDIDLREKKRETPSSPRSCSCINTLSCSKIAY